MTVVHDGRTWANATLGSSEAGLLILAKRSVWGKVRVPSANTSQWSHKMVRPIKQIELWARKISQLQLGKRMSRTKTKSSRKLQTRPNSCFWFLWLQRTTSLSDGSLMHQGNVVPSRCPSVDGDRWPCLDGLVGSIRTRSVLMIKDSINLHFKSTEERHALQGSLLLLSSAFQRTGSDPGLTTLNVGSVG
jgi:hypothetical protein